MAENMVRLTAMTPEMYHRYFREYENDSDLYLDKDKYTAYTYSKEKVDQYIQRQVDLKRIPLAIMTGDEHRRAQVRDHGPFFEECPVQRPGNRNTSGKIGHSICLPGP